jgi:transcriptional regulator with XRE-family HTH domain
MAGAVAVEWWPLSDTEKLRRLNGWTIENTAYQLGVSRKKAAAWASRGGEPAWVRREILNLRSGLAAGVPSVLRRGRRNLGLSVKDVSEALGVSLATVRSWERGEDTPHRSRLPEVAVVYGVRENELHKRVSVVRGSSIKKWRESLCITQREAAEKLGVSLATVSRWESGRGRPGPESIENLVSMGWGGF